MADCDAFSLSALDDLGWDFLERTVSRFEESWRSHGPPSLDEYLPPSEHPLRRTVLAELVKIDLEYRWETGERPIIESYLQRWPELATRDDLVEDLLRNECRIRSIIDRTPGGDEIEQRFPGMGQRIDLSSLEEQSRREREVRQELLGTQGESNAATGSRRFAWSVADAAPQLSAGQPFGRYQIRESLGQGSMGSVYRAYDPRLDREVAIKIPQLAEPTMVDQFLREARAAARIRHPNICPIHDVDQIDGIDYMAMSLIEGQPLSELIEQRSVDPQRAAVLTGKLAQALQAVHAAGLVHRDVKASNIMIDAAGEPVLMDFGLARQVAAESASVPDSRKLEDLRPGGHESRPVQSTSADWLAGTPAYLSPERLAGQPADARTDIYSLGVVLYQCLTGRLPFQGTLDDVLRDIATQEPPAPRSLSPEVPAALEAICLKAMAKDPAVRYPSAADLADAVERFLRAPSQAAGRTGVHRRPWFAGLLVAAAATLAGIVVYVNTGSGAAVIEVNDPQLQIRIDGQQVQVDAPQTKIRLDVGAHVLEILQDEKVVEKRPLVIRWRGNEVRVSLGERQPEGVIRLRLDEAAPIPIQRWIETEEGGLSLQVSGDGSTLYAASSNCQGPAPVRVFDVATGAERKDRTIAFTEAEGNCHKALAISADSRYLYLSNYYRGHMTRVDLRTNAKAKLDFRSVAERAWAQVPAISPDGKRLVINLGGDGQPLNQNNDFVAVVDVDAGRFSLIDQVRLQNEMPGQTPSFSADSRFAYFVTSPRSSPDAELCEVSLTPPCTVTRRLAFPHAELAFAVVWADRDRILVGDAAGRRLWKVDRKTFQVAGGLDLDGCVPRDALLLDRAGLLAVSCPMNRTLLLVDLRRETLLGRTTGLREAPSGLAWDGPNRRLFVAHGDQRGGIAVLEVPRLQASIVFASNRGGESYQLWTVNADGSGLRRLTENRSTDACPRWSPDGRSVAFVSNRYGPWQLVLRQLGDRRETVLGEKVYYLSPGPEYFLGPPFDWSPDSREIVAICGDATGLKIAEAGTGQWRTLLETPPIPGPAIFEQVCWDGADGRILVYARHAFDSNVRDLFRVDPKTKQVSRVTRTLDKPATFSGVSASPDGKIIAVLRVDKGEASGKQAVWLLGSDGAERGPLAGTQGQDNLPAVWMPDGRQLVYPSRVGALYHLHLIPAAGGPSVQITSGDWNDVDPDVWGGRP